MMQSAWMVGPAIGGIIVAFNVPIAYVVSAACTGWFVMMLLRMEIRPVERDETAAKPSAMENLFGGLRFIGRNRLLLWLMSLDMFAVLLGGAVYLLPVFAEDILNVGAEGFGLLRSAPAIGALCMALTLAHLPPMKHAGRNLLLAVGGFGAVTIVFGWSENYWLSFAMLFFTGMFDNVSMVIRHTLVQLITPDSMRGRVSAVNGVFVSASNELGGMESGLVAHWFGPVISVVSGGIGTIVVVVTTALASPRLRGVGTMHDIEAEEEKQVQR